MARTTAYRLSPALFALGRALNDRERVRTHLSALVRWQHELKRFPPLLKNAPDATPYVSIYENGTLKGCFGSHEGNPSERIVRAFVLALADGRWGPIADRSNVTAEIAYPIEGAPYEVERAMDQFEPGVHGLAYIEGERTTLLLPSVARDRGFDTRAMFDQLAKKAGKETLEGIVWLVEMETVSTVNARAKDPVRAARAWLRSLVQKDGEIAYAMDPASGSFVRDGTMKLGRIAVAVQALDDPKARRWLARALPKMNEKPDVAMGTWALAAHAGIEGPLLEVARSIDLASASPWHMAQAASVLGKETPEAMWSACVASLDTQPFAPYVAMAARLRGDREVLARTRGFLESALRRDAPLAGGVNVTAIPETALTAVAIEALEKEIPRARDFLLARQIMDVPACMHESTLGAFMASPIAPILRCDVTAHALQALAR